MEYWLKSRSNPNHQALLPIHSKKLQADIDAILQDVLFTTASISIKVVAVETGEVIYAKNAHKLHHPASTTKLFTAATALAKLGSDYQFETTLYTDKSTETQAIGNIYFKGSADPVLQSNDIVKLCDALVQNRDKINSWGYSR